MRTKLFFFCLTAALLSVTCNKDTPSNPSDATVTDLDGNVYHTVTIGTQVWMKENLKVMHYRNGDPIPFVTDTTTWKGLTTGACCSYDNFMGNANTFGMLYNGYAVADSRHICPAGWHVPVNAEWTILINYLGGAAVAGGKMKETGTTHWNNPNTGATNESGFTARAGGIRHSNDASFSGSGTQGIWWSATEPYTPYMTYYSLVNYNQTITTNVADKCGGLSVRCVKD